MPRRPKVTCIFLNKRDDGSTWEWDGDDWMRCQTLPVLDVPLARRMTRAEARLLIEELAAPSGIVQLVDVGDPAVPVILAEREVSPLIEPGPPFHFMLPRRQVAVVLLAVRAGLTEHGDRMFSQVQLDDLYDAIEQLTGALRSQASGTSGKTTH